MSTPKTYGPVEWPDAIREQACVAAKDRDCGPDETEVEVRGWIANFEALASQFREEHEALIARIVRLSPPPPAGEVG